MTWKTGKQVENYIPALRQCWYWHHWADRPPKHRYRHWNCPVTLLRCWYIELFQFFHFPVIQFSATGHHQHRVVSVPVPLSWATSKMWVWALELSSYVTWLLRYGPFPLPFHFIPRTKPFFHSGQYEPCATLAPVPLTSLTPKTQVWVLKLWRYVTPKSSSVIGRNVTSFGGGTLGFPAISRCGNDPHVCQNTQDIPNWTL